MRTVLCILGVALATTFVVAVGATTLRYTAVIRETNLLFNGKIMVVSKDSIVIQAVPIGGGMLSQNHTIKEIRDIAGVQRIIPVLFTIPSEVSVVNQLVPTNFTIGIPIEEWQSVLGVVSLKGNVGHVPTNESGNDVVVGVSLADQYNWVIGTELSIDGHTLKVTGILDTRIALLSRSILMPLKLAQDLYYYGQKSVNIVLVEPSESQTQKDLAGAIEQKMTSVNALTEEERNDIIQPVLAQVETWNRGIQVVILLMSLILVMTVMVMSVSERRRDFAALDAIGAPLSFSFRMVLLEASFVGILGGILGLILGSLSALLLASLYTSIPLALFFPSLFEIVPPIFMLEMFAAIVAVCCTGGIVPALTATRMRIAETLRAEY